MGPKEGQILTKVDWFRQHPIDWGIYYDRNTKEWKWTFMGNQPTPANPFNSGSIVAPEPISPSVKLDKGDYCQLKVSKRKFRIMDERKDSDNNFEELCKFDDDARRPIWLPHSWLVGEVNILEKAN